MSDNQEIKHIRYNAPKPFGLYAATCMGLDGGVAYYMQNFTDSQFVDFCNGIKKYRSNGYIPRRNKFEVIKQKGRVKLLEFAKHGKPILLVPSLINKYYIFDLYEDNSFISYLIDNGFKPFIIDWGIPSENEEEKIDLRSSVEDYIIPFSKFLYDQEKTKLDVLGYCMGGTLAISAVIKEQKYYKSLSLVSTPVDFNEMPFSGMMKFYKDYYLYFLSNNNVSVELIQTLFYMQDCKGVISRIKGFDQDQSSEQMKRMVSLEDWLSDCVELENVLAADCINYWYVKNNIYTEDLDMSEIKIPCCVVTAKKDSIVPAEASLAIKNHVGKINHIEVDSGHIGVMIGRKSKDQFYSRLKEFLED